MDTIWKYQATHGGFFKLQNVKISKKFYVNIDILLDPSITIETPGYSRLVSWSLNDTQNSYIDITWLQDLLHGFARITKFKMDHDKKKNRFINLEFHGITEGFVVKG